MTTDERLEALTATVAVLVTKIDMFAEAIPTYVLREVYDRDREATNSRLASLEDTRSRLVWLIVSPLIGAIVVAAAIVLSQR